MTEVKVPSGAPYVVERRDDGTISIEQLHDFAAEDAALLHDAVVVRGHLRESDYGTTIDE